MIPPGLELHDRDTCGCGCSHARDHGACAEYIRGGNGRCVGCDHGPLCHPGAGPLCNGPLGPVSIGATRMNHQERRAYRREMIRQARRNRRGGRPPR